MMEVETVSESLQVHSLGVYVCTAEDLNVKNPPICNLSTLFILECGIVRTFFREHYHHQIFYMCAGGLNKED
jgi:hypothetical protein